MTDTTSPERPDGIVVTGASSGIGAACALHLDRLGFLVFAGVRKPEDGELLKRAAGSRLLAVQLDVTDPTSIATAVRQVEDLVGKMGLAGLVNNAGIGVTGPVEAVSLADWRRQFDVNLFGAIAMAQACLPLLRRGRGRIINMSSIAGRANMPYMSPYSASKHALEAVSDALRVEVQPFGVRVAVIEPGAIATPIWSKSKKEADEHNVGWPPEFQRLYTAGFTKVKDAAMRAADRAAPASMVAAPVAHALTASRPKTRYLVGTDAKIRAILTALLPDWLQDELLTRLIGLAPRV
jgi:NAD(P)-dependent dehydrogenase (short-subunit alcohol dehydrogenase family)